MAAKGNTKPAATRASTSAKGAPPRLRLRLASMDDVKTELARLYREAKSGKRDTQDASRMANMLSILGRLIEGSDLEKRILELEKLKQEEGGKWPTKH